MFSTKSPERDKTPRRFLMVDLKQRGLHPGHMITDEPKAHLAARRQMGRSIKHTLAKRLNNRAENSHLPPWPRLLDWASVKSLWGNRYYLAITARVSAPVRRYWHLFSVPSKMVIHATYNR